MGNKYTFGQPSLMKAIEPGQKATLKFLDQPKHSFSNVSSAVVPKEAGVYAIYDKRLDVTIYIGRTRNLRRRLLGNHKSGNIRGSQFRKALGQKFTLKSEGEITSYILENCS